MDYKKTVENVMTLLKEKEVCSNSLKSHKECYQSLEDFLLKENAAFSSQMRDRWLDFVKDEGPPQKYAVWIQYLIQLEEVDATGTISDRHLYLNRSDYEKLPGSWQEKLDLYLEYCRPEYTARSWALKRHYCSKALLFFTDNGITDLDGFTYDTIFMLAGTETFCSKDTKALTINHAAQMLQFWAAEGLCPENFHLLLNSDLYPQILRLADFPDSAKDIIQKASVESLDFPASEFRDTISPFKEALSRHGYVGTTLYLADHALTVLYLFLDIHSLGFHPDIMWAWFSEIKKNLGHSWLHWRRVLKTYEDYTLYGDILPDSKYQYEASSFDLLPDWCRQAIDGFLNQKRRELREKGTVRSYRYSCIRFCRFLLENGHESFKNLCPTVIKAFSKQDEHKTFKGRASTFVVVRGFLCYLHENHYTEAPNLDRCLASGTAPVEKIVDVLTDDQMKRIDDFRKTHREPIELRDIAIVLLGVRMGLRASDVLNLRFSDIDWIKHEISIIMIKTKTQINLPLPVEIGNAIYAYIRNGRPKTGGEFIFIRSKAPYGKLTGKVCTKALYRLLPERKSVAGGGFHVTRRTFATNLLRNHAGIDDVMDALGHRDPSTVMKYLLLDDERSRKCGLSLKDAGIPMEGGLA